MKLPHTLLLAAHTSRSKAYAQAIKNSGIQLQASILFGVKPGQPPKKKLQPEKHTWPDAPVYLPDLSASTEDSLKMVCEDVLHVRADHVNDPMVEAAVKKRSPELVIYSGYGGQILGKSLLQAGPAFLHLHSGWLPDFRGSTTLYYQLLTTGHCAVSAICMNEAIDTGPILARKRYPPPPPCVDIDYLYDNAIRADLLVRVLKHYGEYGALPTSTKQDDLKGETYFIIHPVLKHLARLSLE